MEAEQTSRSVYAQLTTDFMFKRIFGCEESKDILMAFLNRIVGEGDITDLTFQNTEQPPLTEDDRKAVFDVSVRTAKGEEYIIEMQLASQEYFRDRALFYASYPITRHPGIARMKYLEEHGSGMEFKWDYSLRPVKFVGVLDFRLEHQSDWRPDWYYSSYMLKERRTGELMSDRLEFIFLELARFDKTEEELEDVCDKWMYLLKNMDGLTGRSAKFDENEFDRLFERAKLCNFTPEELSNYRKSQAMKYDYQNTINYAVKQGEEKGEEKGRLKKALEVAGKMLAKNKPIDEIVEFCGLTEKQVRELLSSFQVVE